MSDTTVIVVDGEPEPETPAISETDVEQAHEIGKLEAEVEHLEETLEEQAEEHAEELAEVEQAVEIAQATAEIALANAVSEPEPEPEPKPEIQPKSSTHWFTRTWNEWRGLGDSE